MTAKEPKLKVGRAYFICSFYLRNSPVPEIETWIYLGENLLSGDQAEGAVHYHYFKRPEAYFWKEMAEESGRYDLLEQVKDEEQDEAESKLRVADSDLEALVYDYEKLKSWVASLERQPNSETAF